MSARRSQPVRARGFSMVETLVALFVLAVGVLGVTALQATSLRGGSSSHQRSQAVLIAYDLMDRLRANRSAALNGDYNRAVDDDLPSGDGAPPLADDDLAEWFNTRLGLLPGGAAAINCGADGTCTVSVVWDDSRAEAGATARQFDFTSEI
ncbi:MAG: type IV pilus modification protein PilV [Gammaproteobacteria bacterium]